MGQLPAGAGVEQFPASARVGQLPVDAGVRQLPVGAGVGPLPAGAGVGQLPAGGVVYLLWSHVGGGDTNETSEGAARMSGIGQVRSEGVVWYWNRDGRYLDFIPKMVGNHHTLKKWKK